MNNDQDATMKMHKAMFRKVIAVTLLLSSVSIGWAAKPEKGEKAEKTASSPAAASGVVLTVNGVPVTEKEIERSLNATASQGKPVTPQLKEQITRELIVRNVLLEEAKRQKMDSAPVFVERLEDIRQRMLVEQVVNDYLNKNPITEADERAEYDRQKKVLGGGESTPQYQLRQVIVKTEQEGRELIARAQKGEAFDKLVAVSIDEGGRANGGLTGWVFPAEMFATLSAVVVNLQKGSVAAAPIPSNLGWHVVKLEDVRPYKIPSYEDSKQQVRQALLTQRRQALIDGLLKKAVIKRP